MGGLKYIMHHFVKPLVRISSLDYILGRELSFGKIKRKKSVVRETGISLCLTDAEPGVSCPKNLEIGFVSFADPFASVFCFNRIFITRNI